MSRIQCYCRMYEFLVSKDSKCSFNLVLTLAKNFGFEEFT